uniref:Helitron helicase-like domain-containing protein n=1 Tax=Lactuca sativa TaxID=4236 RepID=A0A9R1VI79_LACSA|nr:hypothetical protein LSAT_V11C500246540 [Lactuca sativa]
MMKQYRRLAIINWKKKQKENKENLQFESPVNLQKKIINDTTVEKSTNANETIIGEKGATNKRKLTICGQSVVMSNVISKQVNNTKGKALLKQVILSADILPEVVCCSYCNAMKFYSETSTFCCLGRIVLSNNGLLLVMQEAKSFRTYIRTYNNHFAFTSFGVIADKNLTKRNKGIYTFRVQGQVYHFVNDLHPDEKSAKNLQLYFRNTENKIENRLTTSPRLSKDLIATCVTYLHHNPYARFFRNLSDIPCLDEYKIILKTIPTQDQRVYNKPDVAQVEGQENVEHSKRNIEVRTHSNEPKNVEYYYGCYDPLQYPLMFPFGELGWNQHIPKKSANEQTNNGIVTCSTTKLISPMGITNVNDLLNMEESEYYAYKLQIRKHDKSCLLLFGRLLQQYIVDNYVMLETQRLAFYRTQQHELRQEFLQGVVDALASGETNASVIYQRVTYVVEFQKRGLQHAHFLLILSPHYKMHNVEEYDEIVSAEIPNEKSNPHLFRMVMKHMIHGPCGDLNPLNNLYPKAFCCETTQTDNAYPTCRRRDDGVKVMVRGAELDNKWVVPYNPYLLCKFDCYVNFEICSTIKAVKYIYKYICKGCDKISFAVSSNDHHDTINEIDQFQAGEIKLAVIHLPLHLEDYQPITFKKKEQLTNIVANSSKRNRYEQHLNLTYVEFPNHFVWTSDKKIWSPIQTENSIGRIVVCKGFKVATFRESTLLHGYLIDDNSQKLCLQEASVYHMSYELRRLFISLLVYTMSSDPRFFTLQQLFKKKKAKQSVFKQINTFIQSMGRQIHKFNILPIDLSYADLDDETNEIRVEKSIIVSSIHNLNKKQKVAFDTIIGKVKANKSGAFFIDGPGGTQRKLSYIEHC